ncbi:MAG: response regulator [Acidobacteriota bacterium]
MLLAEDDRELRRLLASVLRKGGLEVVEVEDGGRLMELVARALFSDTGYRPPDVIVSDIRMPGFTGLEVLEGLRATDRSTPVILITAFGDEETEDEAFRLGANALLSKPFDPKDLRARIEALL